MFRLSTFHRGVRSQSYVAGYHSVTASHITKCKICIALPKRRAGIGGSASFVELRTAIASVYHIGSEPVQRTVLTVKE